MSPGTRVPGHLATHSHSRPKKSKRKSDEDEDADQNNGLVVPSPKKQKSPPKPRVRRNRNPPTRKSEERSFRPLPEKEKGTRGDRGVPAFIGGVRREPEGITIRPLLEIGKGMREDNGITTSTDRVKRPHAAATRRSSRLTEAKREKRAYGMDCGIKIIEEKDLTDTERRGLGLGTKEPLSQSSNMGRSQQYSHQNTKTVRLRLPRVIR